MALPESPGWEGAHKQGPFQSFIEGVGGLRVPLALRTTLTLEAGTPSLGLTPSWRGLVLPPPAFPLCFLHFLPCAGTVVGTGRWLKSRLRACMG